MGAEVLLCQFQHLVVTAVGRRLLAGLDVVEKLVGQVGEESVKPFTMRGDATPLVLKQLLQFSLSDARVAIEIVTLAGDLGAPEAAWGVKPGLAHGRTNRHGPALHRTHGYPRKARSSRGDRTCLPLSGGYKAGMAPGRSQQERTRPAGTHCPDWPCDVGVTGFEPATS